MHSLQHTSASIGKGIASNSTRRGHYTVIHHIHHIYIHLCHKRSLQRCRRMTSLLPQVTIVHYIFRSILHGGSTRNSSQRGNVCVVVCVCVFFPFVLDIKFVGRTSQGHTGGRSHRIFHPPSFCGACLNFTREKDSAIPFSRRP